MRAFELPGRSVAVSTRGMAATSHPAATLVALETLRAGGNAVDAAIAACAVQGVVEAGSTGIGGDCFALISPRGSTDIVAYNGSGATPQAATSAFFEQNGITEIARRSPHAVTVPGAVEAWARLIADHGRRPLAEALKPAIALAREGYAITPRVAHDLEKQRDFLAGAADAARVFLVEGRAPAVGDIQRQMQLADTLEAIAREGAAAFYRGPRAEAMVAYLAGLGGLHAREDFAAARGEYVAPLSTRYRGRTIYECPPNGQGVIALTLLNILSRFEIGGDPLGLDNLHREIEAARLAYCARDAWLADPRVAQAPVAHLLSEAFAETLAARIDPSRALDPLPALPDVPHSDTVYICVVDEERNAVSLINSIFSPYGSGLLEPQTGVLFQNRGQGFSLEPGHPNRIAPRKRPLHTIIPGMAAENGRVVMPFGVMGGHYQAMGHAHLISKLFDHGLDVQSAIDLPRLFPLPGTRIVEAEGRLRDLRGAALEARGFEIRAPASAIGGAQAIRIDWERGTLVGGSDPRKDGCALGY